MRPNMRRGRPAPTASAYESADALAKNAVAGGAGGDGTVKKQPVKVAKKPGRNDPCPCGKWKADGSRPLKYKECCGRDD